MIDIKLKTNFVNSKMSTPKYAHFDDAGFDLQANITESIVILSGEQRLIPTGLFIALPATEEKSYNWELQIRPRSGLAYKKEISITNSPGTIDAGYRNEIGCIIRNNSLDSFIIAPGDRIAQGVLARAWKANFIEVNDLNDSVRKGGFGSTGK